MSTIQDVAREIDSGSAQLAYAADDLATACTGQATATTAKPFPASPALADSIEALRESKPISSPISEIAEITYQTNS